MRLVTTVHGWVNKSGRMPLYEAIDRKALRFYDQVICVSDDLYELCRSMKIPTERCHLMRNGIDTEVYRRRMTIAEAKAQVSARPERLLLGAAGRLALEKGFEHLIQAVASLIDAGQPIDLWIAGEGPKRGELERLIQQTGRPQHIRLLGQLTDPSVFFQACDIYVLSSLREGLPNVVLEAMALEVPVIATRVAGIPALVEDGVSGLVVDAGSPEAIRAAVLRLVENPEFRLELTRAARAKVEDSYSFADRIGREVAIYDKLLGQPRGSAAGTGAELSSTGS
jgi:glycosyltransferase involved in cell wall biosynthesis